MIFRPSDAHRLHRCDPRVPGDYPVPVFTTNLFSVSSSATLLQFPGWPAPPTLPMWARSPLRLAKIRRIPALGLDYQLHGISTVGPKVLEPNSLRCVQRNSTRQADQRHGQQHADRAGRAGGQHGDLDVHESPIPATNRSRTSWSRTINWQCLRARAGGRIQHRRRQHEQLLDPDEVWLFTATGVAVAGQYANLGTATGTGTVSGHRWTTPIRNTTSARCRV